MSADGGAPGPPLRKGGDGDGDGAGVRVAGAESSLSEAVAALQGEIDTLKAEIKQNDAELREDGVKIADRLAALKPEKDWLVKLQEEKVLLLQQQLQTQAGVPAQGTTLWAGMFDASFLCPYCCVFVGVSSLQLRVLHLFATQENFLRTEYQSSSRKCHRVRRLFHRRASTTLLSWKRWTTLVA